jgi:transposase
MHPKIDDPKAFELRVGLVCTLYRMAAQLHEEGVNVVSLDEKTGIQALESLHPAMPAKPGHTRCEEFEYTRHGTICLTANQMVATGKVFNPTISATREEEEYVGHVRQTIRTEPEKWWIMIADNLNTHLSAGLVKFIAAELKLDIDLGVKGKSGILKSMETRRKFLENPEHRIHFVFTPRHCSWLNQIEIWFSKLSKRILKHGSHASTGDLEAGILNFIDHHNETAKPYKWKCNPKEVVNKVMTALNRADIK